MSTKWPLKLKEKIDREMRGHQIKTTDDRFKFLDDLLEFLFDENVIEHRQETCKSCQGLGKDNDHECWPCAGEGFLDARIQAQSYQSQEWIREYAEIHPSELKIKSGIAQQIIAECTALKYPIGVVKFKDACKSDPIIATKIDPNYCAIHKCAKTWMISSSFCKECEKLVSKPETKAPIKSESNDPNGFQIIDNLPHFWDPDLKTKWQAKYGPFWYIEEVPRFNLNNQFIAFKYRPYQSPLEQLTHGALPYVSLTTLIRSGYPLGKTDWHDSIAKVWPI